MMCSIHSSYLDMISRFGEHVELLASHWTLKEIEKEEEESTHNIALISPYTTTHTGIRHYMPSVLHNSLSSQHWANEEHVHGLVDNIFNTQIDKSGL